MIIAINLGLKVVLTSSHCVSRFSYYIQGQFSPEPCDDFTLAVASEIVEDEIKSGELEGMESRYLTAPLGGIAIPVGYKVLKIRDNIS